MVQVSSVSCATSYSKATVRPIHPCVFTLTDGRRLGCPPSFARSPQTVYSLEHAAGCRRLAPFRIPLSWRPVLAALERARGCLTGRGLKVLGGPSLGMSSGSGGPIGELDVVRGRNAMPTLIGYYRSAEAARRFEPAALRNARRVRRLVDRIGEVIVFWPHPPIREQRVRTEGCVFAQPSSSPGS